MPYANYLALNLVNQSITLSSCVQVWVCVFVAYHIICEQWKHFFASFKCHIYIVATIHKCVRVWECELSGCVRTQSAHSHVIKRAIMLCKIHICLHVQILYIRHDWLLTFPSRKTIQLSRVRGTGGGGMKGRHIEVVVKIWPDRDYLASVSLLSVKVLDDRGNHITYMCQVNIATGSDKWGTTHTLIEYTCLAT